MHHEIYLWRYLHLKVTIGTFVPTIKLDNMFKATMDTSGQTDVDSVVFRLGDRKIVDSDDSNGWSFPYDMADLSSPDTTFTTGFATQTIITVAYNKNGFSNHDTTLVKFVWPVPDWIKLLKDQEFLTASFRDNTYNFELDLPIADIIDFRISHEVPFIGGTNTKLGVNATAALDSRLDGMAAKREDFRVGLDGKLLDIPFMLDLTSDPLRDRKKDFDVKSLHDITAVDDGRLNLRFHAPDTVKKKSKKKFPVKFRIWGNTVRIPNSIPLFGGDSLGLSIDGSLGLDIFFVWHFVVGTDSGDSKFEFREDSDVGVLFGLAIAITGNFFFNFFFTVSGA